MNIQDSYKLVYYYFINKPKAFISNELNISVDDIESYIQDFFKLHKANKTTWYTYKFVEEYENNVPISKISEKYGISVETINKKLDEYYGEVLNDGYELDYNKDIALAKKYIIYFEGVNKEKSINNNKKFFELNAFIQKHNLPMIDDIDIIKDKKRVADVYKYLINKSLYDIGNEELLRNSILFLEANSFTNEDILEIFNNKSKTILEDINRKIASKALALIRKIECRSFTINSYRHNNLSKLGLNFIFSKESIDEIMNQQNHIDALYMIYKSLIDKNLYDYSILDTNKTCFFLYKNGVSAINICRLFNMSLKDVEEGILEYIKVNNATKYKLYKRKFEFYNLLLEGYSTCDIAKKYNITAQRVSQIVNDYCNNLGDPKQKNAKDVIKFRKNVNKEKERNRIDSLVDNKKELILDWIDGISYEELELKYKITRDNINSIVNMFLDDNNLHHLRIEYSLPLTFTEINSLVLFHYSPYEMANAFDIAYISLKKRLDFYRQVVRKIGINPNDCELLEETIQKLDNFCINNYLKKLKRDNSKGLAILDYTEEELQEARKMEVFEDHLEFFPDILYKCPLSEIKKISSLKVFKDNASLLEKQTFKKSAKDITDIVNLKIFVERPDLLKSYVIIQSKKEYIEKMYEIIKENSIVPYINTRILRQSPATVFARIEYLKDIEEPLLINCNNGKIRINPLIAYSRNDLELKCGVSDEYLKQKYPYNSNEKVKSKK